MNALRQLLDRQVFSALMFVRIRPEPGRVALPDMCCDLVWRGERLMLSGPMSRGHAIESHGGEIQLLNLDPLAFRAIAGMPMVELTDQSVPIADLLPDLAGPMAELFFTGRAGDLVEAPSRRRHHPRIGTAAEAIRAGATVAKAAELVSLSVRQLERHFLDQLGLSPNRFRRIMRLRHSIELAKAGETLAGAAAIAGFADQPHFTREAKALTGFSPGALLPNVGKLQDSIVAARDY